MKPTYIWETLSLSILFALLCDIVSAHYYPTVIPDPNLSYFLGGTLRTPFFLPLSHQPAWQESGRVEKRRGKCHTEFWPLYFKEVGISQQLQARKSWHSPSWIILITFSDVGASLIRTRLGPYLFFMIYRKVIWVITNRIKVETFFQKWTAL